jgi:hypothetical protein
MIEDIKSKTILSEDIKENIKKLKTTLNTYMMEKDKKRKYRLIFEASYLIEKIIFYTQLERGVSKVAVYTYKEGEEKINPNPVTYIERIEKIDYFNDEFINKLFVIREYIVNEYKKLKR